VRLCRGTDMPFDNRLVLIFCVIFISYVGANKLQALCNGNIDETSGISVPLKNGQYLWFSDEACLRSFLQDPNQFIDNSAKFTTLGNTEKDRDPGKVGHPLQMMMMPMYFESGINTLILFEGWATNDNIGIYLLSCFVIFLSCVLHEWLTSYRLRKAKESSKTSISEPLLDSDNSSKISSNFKRRLSQTLLYFLNIVIAYAIMLTVMTFNVGLFFIVTTGLALGHYLFAE